MPLLADIIVTGSPGPSTLILVLSCAGLYLLRILLKVKETNR